MTTYAVNVPVPDGSLSIAVAGGAAHTFTVAEGTASTTQLSEALLLFRTFPGATADDETTANAIAALVPEPNDDPLPQYLLDTDLLGVVNGVVRVVEGDATVSPGEVLYVRTGIRFVAGYTDGSAVVTSDRPVFTDAMIGRFLVDGGGNLSLDGGTRHPTVVSVESPTSLTMSDEAPEGTVDVNAGNRAIISTVDPSTLTEENPSPSIAVSESGEQGDVITIKAGYANVSAVRLTGVSSIDGVGNTVGEVGVAGFLVAASECLRLTRIGTGGDWIAASSRTIALID